MMSVMLGKDLGVASHPAWCSLSICRKWASEPSLSGPAGSCPPSAASDSHGGWLHGLRPVRALQGPRVGAAGHWGATQDRKWSSGRKTRKSNLLFLWTPPPSRLLFTFCTPAVHGRDLSVPQLCHSFATLCPVPSWLHICEMERTIF